MNALLITAGNFLFKYRNLVFPLFMVSAPLWARPRLAWGRADLDLALDLAGAAVCVAGQALRVAAVGLRYIKRGGRDKRVYADTLVEEGMFAHCRNPLYLGNILIFLGMLLILHAPTAYVVGIPAVLFAYAAIIAAEEHYLSGKFGPEYTEYRARVNRMIPNFSGFGRTLETVSMNWPRVVVREYGTLCATAAVALLLRMWTVWETQGVSARGSLLACALGLLPVGAAYLAARHAKFSRRWVIVD